MKHCENAHKRVTDAGLHTMGIGKCLDPICRKVYDLQMPKGHAAVKGKKCTVGRLDQPAPTAAVVTAKPAAVLTSSKAPTLNAAPAPTWPSVSQGQNRVASVPVPTAAPKGTVGSSSEGVALYTCEAKVQACKGKGRLQL
jgi:hypothetical protein